ncbi:MAG: YlbF family regulator [Clostridia bacterium]|nr:YlbF family regulator [Clostridia bacterium]
MDRVIECTRALGEAITSSGAYAQMKLAEEEMERDPAAAAIRANLEELKARHLAALRSGDEEAENLYAQVQEMEKLLSELPSVEQAMTARQAFSELMNRVNQVLEFTITGEVRTAGGCSGSCATCGGCAGAAGR